MHQCRICVLFVSFNLRRCALIVENIFPLLKEDIELEGVIYLIVVISGRAEADILETWV